jgi:hypothetical protein
VLCRDLGRDHHQQTGQDIASDRSAHNATSLIGSSNKVGARTNASAARGGSDAMLRSSQDIGGRRASAPASRMSGSQPHFLEHDDNAICQDSSHLKGRTRLRKIGRICTKRPRSAAKRLQKASERLPANASRTSRIGFT